MYMRGLRRNEEDKEEEDKEEVEKEGTRRRRQGKG